jgi:hypothetical protein
MDPPSHTVSDSNARRTLTAKAPPYEVILSHPKDRPELSSLREPKERFTSTMEPIGLSKGDPEDTRGRPEDLVARRTSSDWLKDPG